ncbi:MAG: hypothetical protein PHS34_07580 [Candidatus Omnitrophica bacterium]|nr:hypothetical protein [Candidatus Omnitrophota bacterium]
MKYIYQLPDRAIRKIEKRERRDIVLCVLLSPVVCILVYLWIAFCLV